MTEIARPSLASVLATVTDRPVGHWIAELKSPAFRGGWYIGSKPRRLSHRLSWGVKKDVEHKLPPANPTEECIATPWAGLTITDPAEALEALVTRGVLPPSFAGDASRWFWCDRCNGKGNGEWRNDVAIRRAAGADKRGCEGRHWPHARTLLDLLAWASLGADAITRAEQLAREAATRLRPWGVRPPVETATTPDGRAVECEKPWRVVWKVGAARPNITGWPAGPQAVHDAAEDHYEFAQRWHEARLARTRRDETTHETLATWYETHAELWPRGEDEARGVESPHAPVAALLRMGLALDAIDGDALMLVCPPLGDSNA